MLKEINNYINDKEFRINIFKDKINIVNYENIISLEDSFISLLTTDNKIIIKGKNLVLLKILEKELLIKGKLKSLEVIDGQ